MKDSFVFYSSFALAASTLGDKARLKLYDAVVRLGLCCAESVTELEQVCSEIETSLAQNRNVFAQFLLIKPQIISNFSRYINGSKGAKYGALGGAPKGNKNAAKNNPETTPNVNDNVNVNVKEKENIKEKEVKREIFKKPSLEEVEAYCQERANGVDPEKWFNYYTANGWKVGKNSMKDWKAAVRTWERNEENTAPAIPEIDLARQREEDERYARNIAIVEATKRRLEEQVKAKFGV